MFPSPQRALRARVVAILVPLLMTTLATFPARAHAAGTGSIAVHAVGDRDPVTGDAIALPGAPFTAYADAALTTPVGSCTTDAAGSCSITGLADGTYWVAPSGDPAGGAFHAITRLTTAFAADVRYAEPVSVGEGEPTTRRFAF